MPVIMSAPTGKVVSEMGTSAYKGNTQFYRSVGQNVMIASRSYHYNNGYFGYSSPSTGSRTRNISSEDSLNTAKDFYDKIAIGGKEQRLQGGKLSITTMADGTVITMRTKSRSDGTPVVEINIDRSGHSGGIKRQKIHFTEG